MQFLAIFFSKQECIPVGCVPSAAVAVSRAGGVPGPGGYTWSQGGVPGPGGVPGLGGVYLVPGGVPGPGGVYLVLGGVPGLGGCTWSWGVYLVWGVCLVRYSPPVDRHTAVKT